MKIPQTHCMTINKTTASTFSQMTYLNESYNYLNNSTN